MISYSQSEIRTARCHARPLSGLLCIRIVYRLVSLQSSSSDLSTSWGTAQLDTGRNPIFQTGCRRRDVPEPSPWNQRELGLIYNAVPSRAADRANTILWLSCPALRDMQRNSQPSESELALRVCHRKTKSDRYITLALLTWFVAPVSSNLWECGVQEILHPLKYRGIEVDMERVADTAFVGVHVLTMTPEPCSIVMKQGPVHYAATCTTNASCRTLQNMRSNQRCLQDKNHIPDSQSR
jgi:hypothetical protein